MGRGQREEFHAVRQLLGPDGVLVKLLYKLTSDPAYRYEFPLSCLPIQSRLVIEDGGVPLLYINKLQFAQGQGRPHNMLLLNAFEYYFFHFFYHMVNPQNTKSSGWTNPQEALYPVLVEDYLNYLLPTDGKPVTPMPHMAMAVRSPVAHQSPTQRHPSHTPSSPGRNSSMNRSFYGGGGGGLLKMQSPLQRVMSSPGVGAGADQTEQETWRSQTFLQVMVEFLLNQAPSDMDKLNYAQRMASESYLPSADHVRLVRMVLKHLHFFVNSASAGAPSSTYSHGAMSMDDFKRSVWSQFVQKRLFTFLRNGFEKWPLDSSFRLILETWLSYIQPWRYTDPTMSKKEKELEGKERRVDEKWRVFIVENLLFYTLLFQDLLPRMFRLDLSSPKNAYMLFRVTKVFSLPNLCDMIENAENALFEPMIHTSSRSPDLGASYLSQSRHHPSSLASMLNSQITELCGAAYQYTPLFSDPTTLRAVHQLLAAMQQATVTARTLHQKAPDANNSSILHWIGLGPMVDFNASKFVSSDYDEFGGSGDSKKLETHLDQGMTNLCSIFHIVRPHEAGKAVTFGSHQQSPGGPESLAPDFIQTDEGGYQLTPLGRYQLMNGLRKFDVQYRGDPDLQPIRSFENPFLVRTLHQLATYLNEKYADMMDTLYNKEGFVGKVARQYIHPPSLSPSPKGSKSKTALSPPSHQQLKLRDQPRISLRWLASYQSLGYILAGYLFAYMWWGMDPIGYLILFLVAGLLYGMFKAAFMSSADKVK